MFTTDYDDILAHEAALEARASHDCEGRLEMIWGADEIWCPECEIVVSGSW